MKVVRARHENPLSRKSYEDIELSIHLAITYRNFKPSVHPRLMDLMRRVSRIP